MIGKFVLSLVRPSNINRVPRFLMSIDRQTSRQIEDKMRQQRWKNIQNQFKSIKSAFGLNAPQKIPDSFEKPKTIDYTMDTLREYSREYPQFLFSQLNNPRSEFYGVIDKAIQNLWRADKKQTLEFLEFLHKWNLKNQQLTERAVQRFDLDMHQIFSFLKWYGYNNCTESLVINRLDQMDPSEYQPLFKIINYVRFKDLGSQDFFLVLQRNLKENLSSIPPSALARVSVHYANSIKQNIDTKINILQMIRERLTNNIKFLSSDELLAVMYSYLRNDLLTEQLLTAIAMKIQLNYFEFTPQMKKKIFDILSNFPQMSILRILGIAQKEFIKSKTVPHQILPEFFFASFQSGMLTSQLVSLFSHQILQNVLNMTPEDVQKSLWVFCRVASQKQRLRMNKKIQVIIQGGLRDYKIKQVSVLVWALCTVPKYVQETFKQNFWNNLEDFIQQRLQNNESNKLSDCSYVLWAYLNNRPLKRKTLRLITDIIVKQKDFMQPFFLVNITAFYYGIQLELNQQFSEFFVMKPIILDSFEKLLSQMSILQVIKCFRYIQGDVSDQIFLKTLKHIQQGFNEISYKQCLSIMGILIHSNRKSKLKQSLIVRLSKKIKQLESVTQVQ